jgi:hypothetical protein
VSPANLYPLTAAGKPAPAPKVETTAAPKAAADMNQTSSVNPFAGIVAKAAAPKDGEFAGVPGKGQLLVARDPGTSLFVAYNRNGGQYVLPAATSMDDAKAAARRIIEGGGVSQANLYPLAATEKAASPFKTSVTVSQNRTVGTTQASAKQAWLKEQGGTTTLNETSVSVKTAGLTTDNSLNASASFDPKKAAPTDFWGGLAGFLGVKKAEASVGLTVGRRDSNVAEFKAARGKAPDFKTYDETTKLGMRASGSLEMNVLGQPVKLAVEPVAIKVAERNDGRGQYTEIATTAGASTSMNSIASAAAEEAGSRASPRGTLASAKADVGSFLTTAQQTLATQLDPAAVSNTGVIDGARVAGASIAGLTKNGIKAAAQTPLAIVQTALQTGAAIADGTKGAADATLRAGFEAVGLKDAAASMGQKTPGVVEAGDIFRAGSSAVGAVNGAVGSVVDGTVGATTDAIRLAANGDDRRAMSPEEMQKAGYGSLSRLQENVNAASTQLRDNPAMRAPSLPTSWGEVRRRLTPQ